MKYVSLWTHCGEVIIRLMTSQQSKEKTKIFDSTYFSYDKYIIIDKKENTMRNLHKRKQKYISRNIISK